MNDEEWEMEVKSAEWPINQVLKLLEEYKLCKTEYAKSRVEQQLRCMWQKMNYEGNKLAELLRKARDEGFEF